MTGTADILFAGIETADTRVVPAPRLHALLHGGPRPAVV